MYEYPDFLLTCGTAGQLKQFKVCKSVLGLTLIISINTFICLIVKVLLHAIWIE